MAQATLLGPDLGVGSEITDALEEAGIKLALAMFMISSDYGDWRYAIASPSLDQTSKIKAYEQIFGALNGRFQHKLPQIVTFPTKDPMVRELRKRFATASDVTGMRLGGQMWGNRFIEEAYVYRIR